MIDVRLSAKHYRVPITCFRCCENLAPTAECRAPFTVPQFVYDLPYDWSYLAEK